MSEFITTAKVLLASLAVIITTPAAAMSTADYHQALAAWEGVLARHVDSQGRVDFQAVAQAPADLEHYVTVVAAYGPDSHPEDFAERNAVLAYHANTYNALAMWGVIERGIPAGFTRFLQRASFFRFRPVTIAGNKTNLSDYENEVIRPLAEPRMHFALNCMVRDCPRLPQQPFLADTLDAQLEAVTLEFFRDPRKLRVNDKKREIRVSSILDFYTEDFVESGKARDLPQYINHYLDAPLPEGYKLRFIDYDWRINRQAVDGEQ